MKRSLVCFFTVFLMMVLGACHIEETTEQKTIQPFDTATELFLYEGTKGADVIAVDEEGYLYTATRITEIDTEKAYTASEYVYEPLIQQFKVYDLEGNCVREAEVGIGDGDISFLTAEEGKLYCIVMKSMLDVYGPTLYTIDTKTWEVTELYQFEDYIWITNFAHVDDYFYVIGQLKEVPEKSYELHSRVSKYTYTGESISRIKVGEEYPQEEFLPVEFPIDIVGTKNDTLLIYHYNEENGFGFLEFCPKEITLKEVGWTQSSVPVSYFAKCENNFLFYKNNGIFYGTVNDTEAKISSKNILITKVPTYQRGFLFYIIDEGVERVGITDIIKENIPIRLLMNDYHMTYEPYDNGYQVERKVLNSENYASKVLAQDSKFDMYLLNSRSAISYNIKENGVFYALNEVDGVQEYLDACFPYIKETAINEEGDVWMVPVGIAIPTLMYHKEYCAMEGVDLSKMNFEKFLTLVEQVETEASEQGMISTFLLIEELFYQYLSVYNSFDTELFRSYAKQLRRLEENAGRLYLDISLVTSVKPVTVVGVDTTYTQEQLEQIPYFFYEHNFYTTSFSEYTERLGNSDMIGVTGIPSLAKDITNVGVLTFLAVNPKSKNLETTLAYISDFCNYMMGQKDSFLLADESMYTDIPFIKECYQVYANGNIFFAMENDIYLKPFWEYIEGEVELEELIKEMEKKLRQKK